MSRVSRLLGCALACAAALGPRAAAGAEELERILAVVRGHPVLLTEVVLAQQVRGLDRGPAVEALVDEWLMYQEASRLPQTAGDREHAWEALLTTLPPEIVTPELEPDLRRMAFRQARILQYIEFRFRPLVHVDDEDVQEVYSREIAPTPNAPPFESVSAQLRERLERRDLDQKIEAWVQELRSSAGIRYNHEP